MPAAVSNAVLCLRNLSLNWHWGVWNISRNLLNLNYIESKPDRLQIFKALIKLWLSLMCLVPMQRSLYLHTPIIYPKTESNVLNLANNWLRHWYQEHTAVVTLNKMMRIWIMMYIMMINHYDTYLCFRKDVSCLFYIIQTYAHFPLSVYA